MKIVSRTNIFALLVAAVAAAASAALVAVLVTDDGEGDERAVARPAGVTVDEVVANPSRFFETRVTLAAQVREILGRHSFLLGGSPFFAGDELLVVTGDPVTVPAPRDGRRTLLESDIVGVTGELRPFDLGAFQQDAGAALEDALVRREGQPALLADEVDVTPRLVPMVAPVTIEELQRAPERYRASLVSVEGRVTETLGRSALVLDDRLLVVALDTPDAELVRVVGTVRELDPDQADALAGEDLDEDLFADFLDRPALVAYTIEPASGRER